jgi:Flp pilus assembly protein TadG
MTEFALVAPILLVLLFSVLEGSFLLFTVATARFATGEAARQLSEDGNAVSADQNALAVIRKTALATTSLGTVNHVDIYRLTQGSDGTLSVDLSHFNSYKIDGSPIGSLTWPPASRDITNGEMDFLGVTIYYQYNWKSGFFSAAGNLKLNSAVYIRLEPQLY